MRLTKKMAVLLFVCFLSMLLVQGAAFAEEAKNKLPELGLYLEGVKYPFPVERFHFESQGHKLEMAYMDVKPEGEAKKTVLLLHGKNFNGAYWGRLARDLQANGYRVIIPDQLGFGKSSKPLQYQWSFHQLARNTKDLLDKLGIEKVVVFGHSMGGMVATRFALMYPEMSPELVLLNPIGLEDWKRVAPYKTVDEWYAGELKKTPKGIRKYQLDSYYDGKWKPEYDRWVELLAGTTSSPGYPQLAKVQAALYDMIYTQPVCYEFSLVKSRTLLLIGTRDRTALNKNLVSEKVRATMGRYELLGKKVAAQIPGATLVEFDNVGHMPHIEVYDRFLPPLLKWLSNK